MKTYKILGNGLYRHSILNSGLIVALFLAVTLSPLAHSHGQGTDQSAAVVAATADQKNQAKQLTLQLGKLIAEYKAAVTASSSSLANQLTALAEERRQLLGQLIENDPAEVLKQALPDDVLDQMPTKAQAFLEQHRTMEGELQFLHVDYKDQSQSHYVYLLSTDTGERYSLHFAKHGPDIQSGSRVRVNGVAFYGVKARDTGETDGAVALDDKDTSLIMLEAGGSTTTTTSTTTTSLPNTLGAQKTLVILVNFQDKPTQPYTPAVAKNVIFGLTSNFFLENSYQQTWLSGDVFGWYTIPLDSTVCDTSAIANYAKQAATSAGVNLSAYTRQVYVFPQNACGWWGLSGVGGNPSQSWINGSLELGVAAHELGHGLGLWHSHSLYCGDTAIIGSNCSSAEYGDIVDMMGSSYSAHFNAFQKERLGWLNAGAVQDITTVLSDGTYLLEGYETLASGVKALKILKSTDSVTGQKTWYYVEARKAIGFDQFLANESTQNILNGVIVHTGIEGNGNSGNLLDMTPATPNYNLWYDTALITSQSFVDPDTSLTLTTEWVTGTQAAVTVHLGTGTNLTLSTNQSIYTRGQTVTATVMVTTGGMPAANASVNFIFTKSNGAVVTGKVTTGTNGTAVYKLRLKMQDPIGLYQTNASINGVSNTSAATFTVQ